LKIVRYLYRNEESYGILSQQDVLSLPTLAKHFQQMVPRRLQEFIAEGAGAVDVAEELLKKAKRRRLSLGENNMSENRKPYPCPMCRSNNIRYDYRKGQSECLQCGNIWKADPQGIDLPYPCPKCGKNNVRYDFKGKKTEYLDCGYVWKAEP
jgi:Zn finger protein HypA/HybF involved in hydrogenase expression